MKILISVFFLLICIIGVNAQDTKVSDWTIDLYFKALTDKQLPILDKFKARGSLVKELDYANRYILLANDEWKGWGEIVLLDKKGGGHLLAVTQFDCTKKYVPYSYYRNTNCRGNINLLEYNGKNWIERNKLLPDLPSLQLYAHFEKKTNSLADGEHKPIFELPRERKDILIKISGESVYSLTWNGEKFVGSYVE